MIHKTEVNLKIPNLEDLFCINCNINSLNLQDNIKSLFQCQILTCRLIIFSVRCCIAAPSIKNIGNLVHVIINKKFYSTGKLQEYLLHLKIQFTNPEPVQLKIYKICLKYMFTFKLAPIWNLVGKTFYLQGFNFLTLPCSIDTVEWNILFKDEGIKLEINLMKFTLLPLTYTYLTNNINFCDNSLMNSSFQNTYVFVLPKLTKAKVVSVSKILPENCPFTNYDELRRYWKNMYSYHLPKNHHHMLFYQVVFPVNPNKRFTYPEVCILSKMPEYVACENKKIVASQFIKDLCLSVYSVCGEIIKIGHLFPKLNIKYACIVQKKSINSKKKDKTRLKSRFLKTSVNYVINQKNENSNLFLFQSFHNLSTYVKKTELYLENNKKCKKYFTTNNNTQYTTVIDKKMRKTNKNNYSKKFVKNQSLNNEKITINIDYYYFHYNISSVYLGNNKDIKFLNENVYTCTQKEKKILYQSASKYCIKKGLTNFYSNLFSNTNWIIEVLKKINFDFTGLKKINAVKKLNNSYVMVDEQHLNTVGIEFANLSNMKQLNNKKQSKSKNNCTLQSTTIVQTLWYFDEFESQSNNSYHQLYLSPIIDIHNANKQTDDFKTIIYSRTNVSNQLIKELFEKKIITLSKKLKYNYMDNIFNINKFVYNRDKKNSSNSSIIYANEKQNMRIVKDSYQCDQCIRRYSLNNNKIAKTPSYIFMFSSNSKLEKYCVLANESKYLSSVYNFCCEIQCKKISCKNIFNSNLNIYELQHSNELHINLTPKLKYNINDLTMLTQSSNELNTNNYETYKVACIEALTFD